MPGGGTTVLHYDIVLGLRNDGRGAARFPYLKVRVVDGGHHVKAEGEHRGERYGLPMRDPVHGLDLPATFAGGVGDVVHPGDELHVVRVGGKFIEGDPPGAMAAETWCGADGIAMRQQVVEVDGRQILAALRR